MNDFHNCGAKVSNRLKTCVITACIAAIITQLISLNTRAELKMRRERRL